MVGWPLIMAMIGMVITGTGISALATSKARTSSDLVERVIAIWIRIVSPDIITDDSPDADDDKHSW